MAALVSCEVCGNGIKTDVKHCPFCDAVAEVSFPRQGPRQRIINLEQGMPSVDQALAQLDRKLDQARLEQCRVLTLIHGYGSSGRGGLIRLEIRTRLQYLKHRTVINDYLPGEEFSPRNGSGNQLLRRFPFLRQHRDLNRANPGITLVII